MASAAPVVRDRRARIAVLIVTGIWTTLYAWRSMIGHYSLATNAYDLSLFDYALWSLTRGDAGMVPFIGHSIFSHHFMPVLLLIAPIYWCFQSAAFLLILQVLIVAAAALTFFRVQESAGVHRWLAVILVVIFLFSRRTHGATAGLFYPESLQAVLTFALVLCFRGGAMRFWIVAILLLGTKEDAPIYTAAFGIVQWFLGVEKRRAGALVAVSAAWLLIAMLVAIPLARRFDGLPASNQLLEARFGSEEGRIDAGALAGRLFSATTLGTLGNLTLTTGGLPLLAPIWLAPAVPGMLLNMSAPAHSLQAGLGHHYAWPILPWLFIAASVGAGWLYRRQPRLVVLWVSVLAVGTVADNPSVQRAWRTRLNADAVQVREQLTGVSHDIVRDGVVLAQPNLIPHLPHGRRVFALGSKEQPATPPDVVLITLTGSQWPMTPVELQQEIARYSADADYVQRSSGPLWVFVRRSQAAAAR